MRDGRLPGQRFTADQQCSYFWGKGFEVEIPKEKTMDVRFSYIFIVENTTLFMLHMHNSFVILFEINKEFFNTSN